MALAPPPLSHPLSSRTILKNKNKKQKGWAETPVSIADLGGTEIDLRFASPASQGSSLVVIVAPVLRFLDVGFNADVRIEQVRVVFLCVWWTAL